MYLQLLIPDGIVNKAGCLKTNFKDFFENPIVENKERNN